MNNRIAFLDTLRFFAVLLGLVLLVLRSFIPLLYEWGSLIVLPLLTFISAYFSASVLRIHTFSSFFKQKWLRLGIPWLFALIVLSPIESYFFYLQGRGTKSFIDFLLTSLWSHTYDVSSYWFLGFLLLCCVVLMGIKKYVPSFFIHRTQTKPSPLLLFALFIVTTVLLQLSSSLYWIRIDGGLVFPRRLDWLLVCVIYFSLGIYAFRHRWFTTSGYMPSIAYMVPFILASIAYGFVSFAGTTIPFLFAALRSLLSLTALLGWIALFHNRPMFSAPKAAQLSQLSYPLFWIGEPILRGALYFLMPLAISSLYRSLLALALTLIYAYFLCRYALLHLPFFSSRH